MDAIEWGRRIKAYRKLKGYTQIEFARALSISVSIMGEVERGNRVPSDELINSIAEVLNVSIEELENKA
ncbi:helix-turn-helix domain-containing protein [Aquibacillus kalidii]|uniref:helix-turn-helix domain-containing protein n=1 Tax=Aquibacillus kalidii TaxID=2762597 RepID=UPI001646AB7A|nr:helix-turn-helix transcriptional regulator [Aquibacillus kalidii]